MTNKLRAYLGKDPYIFVSYSHKDKDVVYPFIETLQKRFNVWFDDGIHLGKDYKAEIMDHLKRCELFLFLISENSLNSDFCKKEIYFAEQKKKRFINIIIKNIELPDLFIFDYGHLQCFNLFEYDDLSSAVDDLVRKSSGWFDPCEIKVKKGDINNLFKESPKKVEPKKEEPKNVPAKEEIKEAKSRYIFSTVKVKTAEEYIKMVDVGYIDIKIPYDQRVNLYKKLELIKDKNDDYLFEYAKCLTDFVNGVDYPYGKFNIFTELVERKNIKGYAGLAHCYMNGVGTPIDNKKAYDILIKGNKLESFANIENMLGICYQYGRGVEQNYIESYKWYKKAADKSFAYGQYNLALCYANGHGVGKDLAKAALYYEFAAKQGYDEAQYLLGLAYYQGTGVEKNNESAFKWIYEAAMQGNDNAMFYVGYFYGHGIGTRMNSEHSIYFYKESAKRGNKYAQNNLGRCYLNGRGVNQSNELAYKYFSLSAEQGYPQALFNVGLCYERGIGVEMNIQKAIEYYELALEKGYEPAKIRLDKLRK